MRLYRTAQGAWAGTQADAGKGFAQVDVPVDKPGLLAWLNENARRAPVPTQAFAAPPPPGAPDRKDMGADATLSRMDNPGIDVDAIVETIGRSKGYALKRYAGAVAVAFQSL